MQKLYTFSVTASDGSLSVDQGYGVSAREALAKWTQHRKPGGFIESLTVEDQNELIADFNVTIPTHFGELLEVAGLDSVWRVSTSLRSGLHVIVDCIETVETRKAEQAGTFNGG